MIIKAGWMSDSDMSYSGLTVQIILMSCLSVWMHSAQAEVYKWVDDKGMVHYSDQKPEEQEQTDVEGFFVSPIYIEDSGEVKKAGEDTALSRGVSVVELEQTDEPFFSAVTISRAIDTFKQWLSFSSAEGSADEGVIAKSLDKLKPGSEVISNENIYDILERVDDDKRADADSAEGIEVELFTTPWCGYCKKARMYLEMNDIAYEEYDVSASASAALRQKLLGGGRGVPFAVIDGKAIRGWNQQAYARALGL